MLPSSKKAPTERNGPRLMRRLSGKPEENGLIRQRGWGLHSMQGSWPKMIKEPAKHLFQELPHSRLTKVIWLTPVEVCRHVVDSRTTSPR
ncbi:hypothetical protein EMIT0P253_290035 [Pseudomonas sp. IT-P253]